MGFLLPWTTDGHIRDRLLWSKFSRNLIVRGNVLLAFEEYLERQSAAARKRSLVDKRELDAANAAPVAPSATPRQFEEFERARADYYGQLNRQFKDASAKYLEIDLLSTDWQENLARFLTTSLAGAAAAPETSRLLTARARMPDIKDEAAACGMIEIMPDAHRRAEHIKALIGSDAILGRPLVLIVGACLEELNFVGRTLEQTREFAITDFTSKAVGSVKGSKSQSGIVHAIISALKSSLPSEPVPVLLMPSQIAPIARDLALHEGAVSIIVRGNLFRAFEQIRNTAPDSTRSTVFGDRSNWTGTRLQVGKPAIFMDAIEQFHAEIWRGISSSGTKFVEIDLMTPGWLDSLLDVIGTLSLNERSSLHQICREWVAEHAEDLSSPAPSRVDAAQIVRLIKDDARRAGHLNVLRSGKIG